MTSRTVSGCARPAPAPPAQSSTVSSVCGESRRYACSTIPADGPARNSSSASSSSTSSSTASRESSDSMSMCRCAPSSRARRSRPRSRSAASRLPRSGASGRSSGVSAETLTDRFARGSGPAPSRSSARALGPAAAAAAASVSSASSQRRVALCLRLGDGRLAEQVDRARDAVLPQLAQRAERRLRALADDEAVGHVLDAGGRGGAERGAAGPRGAHPHRDRDGRRRGLDLAEEAGQVAREVVQRAAGGDDVDEAEQRGLELGVLGGELHRLLVGDLERVAHARGQRVGESLADLQYVRLQCGGG